jgi:hypothetical protein
LCASFFPSLLTPQLFLRALETIQVVFFFRSSYFRFVQRFGEIQIDLIW